MITEETKTVYVWECEDCGEIKILESKLTHPVNWLKLIDDSTDAIKVFCCNECLYTHVYNDNN